jgi:predicted nucleotide-binding protein
MNAQVPGDPAPTGSRAAKASRSVGAGRRRDRSNRNVFIIHGRDEQFRERVFEVVRALDLRPMEWESIVSATRHAAPSLLTIIETALKLAQAVVVLLTPDDIVQLHPSLREREGSDGDSAPAMQPRPNVLIELGMALMSSADRTIILEVGDLRPVADLGGLNFIHFDGEEAALGKFVQRLKNAGCPVDDSGTDWRNTRRFAHIGTYDRVPS